MVSLLRPYIIVQPVTRRGFVECFCTRQQIRRSDTGLRPTHHTNALDISRQDLSQTRRPTVAFPAAQTATTDLLAPRLPGAGEPKIAGTWTKSGEVRAPEGVVGKSGGR